jgi:predicted ATPase
MDVITSILARNVRTLVDVRLELRGLTVLVGANGSGKSTLIEVCRLLGRLPSTEFGSELASIHGGPRLLARDPGKPIEIGASVGPLVYWGALAHQGSTPTFEAEQLSRERVVMSRGPSAGDPLQLDVSRSMLTQPLLAEPGTARRALSVFEAIEVHLGLDTLARWGARSVGRHREGMREPQTLGGTGRLDLLGQNLPNAYYALRNEQSDDHWRETIETVRLGLGQDVDTVELPNFGPGEIGLRLKLKGTDTKLQASQLSDGMLAWLAFVAMVRLPHRGGLLAIDEPELHFEPRLLARVVDLLEEHALTRPVLVATHSDRFLDALRDPAASVVTCELGPDRTTSLARPDREALGRWLEEFAGYGALRAAGHEVAVLRKANG